MTMLICKETFHVKIIEDYNQSTNTRQIRTMSGYPLHEDHYSLHTTALPNAQYQIFGSVRNTESFHQLTIQTHGPDAKMVLREEDRQAITESGLLTTMHQQRVPPSLSGDTLL